MTTFREIVKNALIEIPRSLDDLICDPIRSKNMRMFFRNLAEIFVGTMGPILLVIIISGVVILIWVAPAALLYKVYGQMGVVPGLIFGLIALCTFNIQLDEYRTVKNNGRQILSDMFSFFNKTW